MKPDTKILCRVGSKLRDYKVVQVWQWTEDRLEEKVDNYIRADIVDHLIDRLAELERDWNKETGFAGAYTDDMTSNEEIQIEKDQLLKDSGLVK